MPEKPKVPKSISSGGKKRPCQQQYILERRWEANKSKRAARHFRHQKRLKAYGVRKAKRLASGSEGVAP